MQSNDTVFVRYDKIRPCDVLLVNGTSVKSKAISRFSSYKESEDSDGHDVYSHAAIWTKFVDKENTGLQNYIQLTESDGDGVGAGREVTVALRLKTGESIVAYVFRGVKSAKVLRHPQIDTISDETLLEKFMRIEQEHFYRQYPDILHVLEASVVNEYFWSVVTKCRYAINETRKNNSINKGMFCSELVAEIYESIGLMLFSEHIPPHLVSPNQLNHSNLERVDNAIIDFDLVDLEGSRIDEQKIDLSNKYGRSVIKYMVNSKNNSDLVDSYIRSTNDFTRRSQRMLVEAALSTTSKLIFDCSSMSSCLDSIGLIAHKELFQSYKESAEAINNYLLLCMEVIREGSVDYNIKEMGNIIDVINDFLSHVVFDCARSSFLFSIITSKYEMKVARNPFLYYRALRSRREAILKWKSIKSDRGKLETLIASARNLVRDRD